MIWRRYTGGAIWLLILVSAIWWLIRGFDEDRMRAAREVAGYLTTERTRVELKFAQPRLVRTWDPIFAWNNEGELVQVGSIERAGSPDSTVKGLQVTDWAQAEFFSNAPRLNNRHYLIAYETPQSLDFLVRTMFPETTRREIARLITQAYTAHHQEILNRLQPVLEKGLEEVAVVLQEEFQAAIEAHQTELSDLGTRYRETLLEEEVIPLVSEEIWPIVQRTSQPLVNQIGEKIWQEASLWRFGWAIFYDVTPLPRRDLVKREFNEFLESKAVPIVVEHIPDIIALQQQVLAEIARNQRVQQVLQDSLATMVHDHETQAIVLSILRQVFVENPRLNQVVQRHWTSPETQTALQVADDLLEPTVERIGELLFGNPFRQITPEFNRMLRARVLGKDHRWFLLVEDDERAADAAGVRQPMPVVWGGEAPADPTYYPVLRRD